MVVVGAAVCAMRFFFFLSFFLLSSFPRRPDALRQNHLLLSQEEVMGTEHRSIKWEPYLTSLSEDDARDGWNGECPTTIDNK